MIVKTIFTKTMEDFALRNSPDDFLDPEFYTEWLAQTYFFVRHSTALLGYALPHLKNDQLRHHFEKHLGEETRHDLLAVRDLQKMQKQIEDFREYSSTEAFYQSQYYRIQFQGGTALLGYILFLEGIAVHWGKDIYHIISNVHPGTSFIKVHAEEDPDHLEAALKTILSLPEDQIANVMKNFAYSREIYEDILKRIRTQMEIKPLKRAA